MAFAPMNGRCTGFELGTIDLSPVTNYKDCAIDTSIKHAGSYSLKIAEGAASDYYYRVYVAGTPSDIFVGVWIYPTAVTQVNLISNFQHIDIYLADGNYLKLCINDYGFWDAYVNTNKVASGAVSINALQWHHIAFRVNIADAGNIETRVDGIPDISYSGDTKPSSSNVISYINLKLDKLSGFGPPAYWIYFDDITMGTGGWPPDLRYDAVMVDADIDTTNWVCMTGSNAYALLDERPPSDADYVSTITNDARLILSLQDWVGTNKQPYFVQMVARCKKDEAVQHKLTLIEKDSGANAITGSAQDILMSYTYVTEIFNTAPDGGAWSDAKVDDLRIALKATIV